MAGQASVSADLRAGKITFPRGRAFLLGVDVWTAMKLHMDWNPENVTNLKHQWVEYGHELGKRMQAMVGRDLEMTYAVLEDSAKEAGWGSLRVEGDRLYGTDTTFKLFDCVFCEGLKGRFKEPCCYELSGTIQGIVEVIHGRRTVTETTCAADVWNYCEVKITR